MELNRPINGEKVYNPNGKRETANGYSYRFFTSNNFNVSNILSRSRCKSKFGVILGLNVIVNVIPRFMVRMNKRRLQRLWYRYQWCNVHATTFYCTTPLISLLVFYFIFIFIFIFNLVLVTVTVTVAVAVAVAVIGFINVMRNEVIKLTFAASKAERNVW